MGSNRKLIYAHRFAAFLKKYMNDYCFNTTISLLPQQTLFIRFTYFLPKHMSDWQDKQNGSIRVIEVYKEHHSTPITLSCMEHIYIRRACWNYLESNRLFYQHNITPLPFL